MRNDITEARIPGGETVLPWKFFVSTFRMHLSRELLQHYGQSPAEITELMNAEKLDWPLMGELAERLFKREGAAGFRITFGVDSEYNGLMEFVKSTPEGLVVKVSDKPELTIEFVEDAIKNAYPDYNVWTDGVDRVYVDEGDDDPILMSPKDSYQTYIVDAGK